MKKMKPNHGNGRLMGRETFREMKVSHIKEIQGANDEYIMVFGPVNDHKDVTLEVGRSFKIPLTR